MALRSFSNFRRSPVPFFRSPASITTNAISWLCFSNGSTARERSRPLPSRIQTTRRPPNRETVKASSASRAGSEKMSLASSLTRQNGSSVPPEAPSTSICARSRTRPASGPKMSTRLTSGGGRVRNRSISVAFSATTAVSQLLGKMAGDAGLNIGRDHLGCAVLGVAFRPYVGEPLAREVIGCRGEGPTGHLGSSRSIVAEHKGRVHRDGIGGRHVGQTLDTDFHLLLSENNFKPVARRQA